MRQATAEDVDDVLEDDGILYKHSNTCPVSARAQEHVLAAEKKLGIEVRKIVVQTQRDLSDRVEDVTGIRHESPQLLILRHGEVAWHASHHAITVDAIAENLK